MLLGIVGDFTSAVTLDDQLLAAPDSGLYFNSGVHPSVTVDNLLHFLPNISITPAAYQAGTTYGKYEDTRLKSDLVTDNGIIYQSKEAANIGNTPVSSPDEWLPTDLDSLRLKFFIQSVEDKILSDINLVRRQLDSQYLYDLVEQNDGVTATLLPSDFAAMIFEPKGTDYSVFTINQVALTALTASPQNLYVINQGVLVDTLTLNPNLEGRLVFEELNYTFSGKGRWIFAIDSQNVLTNNAYLDPLKFDGFVAYTASGIGAAPEDAVYSESNNSKGLNFNITVHFDPITYVTNNLQNFGQYYQAAFELETFKMFMANPNNRSNREQRIQMNDTLLNVEIRDLINDTSAKRYNDNKDKAIRMLDKTFDREINDNDDGLVIKVSSF